MARPASGATVRGRPVPWDRWYTTARWRRIRELQLKHHPLCAYCLARKKTTPATVCDHVEPHRGDINKFRLGKLQSLCKTCHDGAKREIELHGYRRDIGLVRVCLIKAKNTDGEIIFVRIPVIVIGHSSRR